MFTKTKFMFRHLFALVFLCTIISQAQPDTEVFLFDLDRSEGKLNLSNYRNISSNEGYDNQPSFLDNRTVLFASTRNGQTDIARYDVRYGSKIWINFTDGSEYSPVKIPGENAVSAIRLDKDGTQQLFKYNLSNGESELLFGDPIVGYQAWYNDNILVASILDEGSLSLVTYYLNEKKFYKLQKKVGRSLHKIPGKDLVSYISKEDENLWEIKSINPVSGVTNGIMGTLPGSEDMCWLADGTILMGHENALYTYNENRDVDWVERVSLDQFKIKNITRLAVSPDGTKLAVVGEGGIPKAPEIPSGVPSGKKAQLQPRLENISWLSGAWRGEALGGIAEEIWSKPDGGAMMASFRLIKDGKVLFYEIEIIRELENSLILQLKHFNKDLTGWEAKDQTVDFPLVAVYEDKVEFDGMSFIRVSDERMDVLVRSDNNGKISTLKFEYTRQ